jgi:uncharacterized protein
MLEPFIKEYCLKACEKPNNKLTSAFYTDHIQMVVQLGDLLGSMLKADNEIVRIAAYLHDISAVLDLSTLLVHDKNSAEIAKSLLMVNQYPKDKINKVYQSILTHSKPLKKGEGSNEQVCLSNADAMAFIANPAYWLYFAFVIRNMTFSDGIKWYLAKIDENWNMLVDPAKELINEKYGKIKNLIPGSKEDLINTLCYSMNKY